MVTLYRDEEGREEEDWCGTVAAVVAVVAGGGGIGREGEGGRQ